MNIAIIGSNGFIGRHLTETLASNPNHSLFLFGKGNTGAFGNRFPYSKLNISSEEEVKAHFGEIDLVYYLASESIPSTTWENPLREIESNLVPFIHFMEHICRLNVKKIAFVSSAGTIYGPTTKKVTEESAKNPFSPYGITKLTMEYYLNYFNLRYGIRSDIYRVSNVYGNGQDTSKGLGIINTFLEHIVHRGAIHIFGNGLATRNYIYIKDVTEMLSLSASASLSVSNIYNLSSDNTLTINELVNIMKKVVDESFEVMYKDTRQSDNSIILLDNSKIKNVLAGYELTPIEEGVKKTYMHIKDQLTKSK